MKPLQTSDNSYNVLEKYNCIKNSYKTTKTTNVPVTLMPSRSDHVVRWALNYQLLYCIVNVSTKRFIHAGCK